MNRPIPLKLAALGFLAAIVLFVTVGALTTVDALRQIRNMRYLDAGTYGVGAACITAGDCSSQIRTAIAAANHQNVPQTLILPPGQFPSCHPLVNNIPNLIITGSGGSGVGNPTEYGGPFGTVLVPCQAGMSNDTGLYFPYNWRVLGNTTNTLPMLVIDGGPDDLNGAVWSNITVDMTGQTHGTAAYVGHANENSRIHDVNLINFDDAGLYICGADNNGNNTTFSAGITLGSAAFTTAVSSQLIGVGGLATGVGIPSGTTILSYTPGVGGTLSKNATASNVTASVTAGYQCTAYSGAQGDGPYEHLYILPRATAKALPVVFYGWAGAKGFGPASIVPTSGGVVEWGGFIPAAYQTTYHDVHMEGFVNGGWVIGASSSSGYCPGGCNGTLLTHIENVNFTNPPSSSIPTLDVYNAANSSFVDIGGNIAGAGCALRWSSPNYGYAGTCSSFNLAYAHTAADGNIETNDPNFTRQFNQFVVFHNNAVINGASANLEIQKTIAPNYPSFTITPDSNDNIVFTAGGGTGNWLDQAAYNVHAQNGLEVSLNGLNTQAPLGAVAGLTVNALFGSNIYFDTSVNQFRFGSIGGYGYAAFAGMQAGQACIATSNAAQPGTVSNATFLAGMGLCVSATGNTQLGAGASTLSDTGARLQVSGTAQATQFQNTATAARPTCNAAARGTHYVEQGTGTSGADEYLVCVQTNSTGPVYGWHQIF